jgi:predicted alpha/beta hydrolase
MKVGRINHLIIQGVLMEPRPHKLTQPDALAIHGALRFTTDDARHLSGTLFRADNPRGAVLINSATGVPQRYYHRFATFLAERGLTTLTYDYRGIGASRVGTLRDSHATMQQWGSRDYPAALRALREAAPDLPVGLIGHSFGGQAIGLSDASLQLDAAILVAAQSGYWGHWPALQRARMRALWTVALPAAVHVWGFLPGNIGVGEDMPGLAALEWAEWCKQPDYYFGAVSGARERLASLTMPKLAYTITDDHYAPAAAVNALLACMPADDLTRRTVAPRDLGLRALGHFGFFRPAHADTLWTEAADFLRDTLR